MTSETDSDFGVALTLGHLRLAVTDLEKSVAFFEAIGARADTRRERFTVVEFGDRTRLQLTEIDEPAPAGQDLQFDFRVGDIDAAWRDCSGKGLNPSEIARRTPGHDWFLLIAPDGYAVKINSGFKRA